MILIILNGSKYFLFFYSGKCRENTEENQQPEKTVSLIQSQNHSIKKKTY